MSEVFLKVVNMSISAGWLILAVLILRLALKKAPRWVNVLLWGIVALRLLCPFTIESALSLIPSAETIPAGIEMDATPAIDSGINAVNRVINPVISASFTPNLATSANPLQILIPLASVLWVFGVVVLLLYTAVSYWRLRRKVDTAVLLRDNIYQSENVSSPFVLGIVRPRIYLPFDMDGKDLEHVVAHEQAHIRRRDHWWKPLGFLLLTLHWFNPLMWLAYLLLCRDIELACDERVIKELGSEQRADYTQALVACSVSRRSIAACPLAFGEVGVKARVKSVMNYKKPAFWLVALAVIVCAVVAVCFLTDPLSSVRNPWVQEYVPGTGNIQGNVDKEKFESISSDFAIGADQYGHAVFKDPHKAFDTFTDLYSDGIVLIRSEFDLPLLSRSSYELYKTYGWQTTTGSENARKQASFVSSFLDLYENSFIKHDPAPMVSGAMTTASAPSLELDGAEESGTAFLWFDHSAAISSIAPDDGQRLELPESLSIELPEFSGVTFRYIPGQITASKTFEGSDMEGHTILIAGMPIWSAYFCDLNGDGLPELCASLSRGSGVIDNRIAIHDYANGLSYELEDRGSYDYYLRLGEDGCLYADKKVYRSDELVATGRLYFSDGSLMVDIPEDEEQPPDYFTVMDNFVTEINRETLRPAVELSDEDAERLKSLIDGLKWSEGVTTDCLNDCAINLGGRLIYYHSDCGTFSELDLSEVSAFSHESPGGGRSYHLSASERTLVNNILSDYIELTYGVTDIAEPTLNIATLRDLVQSYGEELSWEHFSAYYSEDVGSGLYILQYPIADADCCLLIGGGSMELPPVYIHLASVADSERYIDLRSESIDDFLAELSGGKVGSMVFTYDGVEYDLAEGNPMVNAVMGHEKVGEYVIAEGHAGPYNSLYAIINTKTRQVEKYIAGANLIWHSDDINTIVYSFWSQVYAYDGRVLASIELEEPEEFIDGLSFSKDFTQIEVEIDTAGGSRTVTIYMEA